MPALLLAPLLVTLASCGDDGLDPGDGDVTLGGNIEEEDFVDLNAVAYIMRDGVYHFFAVPGEG